MIGLIGAMDEEIALFLREMEIDWIREWAGIDFFQGRLVGKKVVLCRSGIGKVNAAVAAQILVDCFQVQAIIFSGVAGSISSQLKVGDIVISTLTQEYDVNFSAIGFPQGTIPYQETSVFIADPCLVELAEEAGSGIKYRVLKGNILTGDQFVIGRKLTMYLRKTFGGLCVDAEGAAVGQVCCMNKIPFVVIRAISDQVDSNPPSDFFKWLRNAADRAQILVMEMLKKL